MSRKLNKSFNKLVLDFLAVKPIAFNPMLAKVAHSANAGLFMSQLLYWWGKGKKEGWIYKTILEVKEETSLTRGEQDTAIRIWKGLRVLEVKKMGIPPKRHFKIDVDNLLNLLKTANQSADSGSKSCENQQNNTESTQDNTPIDSLLQ